MRCGLPPRSGHSTHTQGELSRRRVPDTALALPHVRVTQAQLDALFALLSAMQTGEVSQAEAMKRLDCSAQWVWVAMDPISKLLLTTDVGDRTLAMAQHLVPQVAQVLAPTAPRCC